LVKQTVSQPVPAQPPSVAAPSHVEPSIHASNAPVNPPLQTLPQPNSVSQVQESHEVAVTPSNELPQQTNATSVESAHGTPAQTPEVGAILKDNLAKCTGGSLPEVRDNSAVEISTTEKEDVLRQEQQCSEKESGTSLNVSGNANDVHTQSASVAVIESAQSEAPMELVLVQVETQNNAGLNSQVQPSGPAAGVHTTMSEQLSTPLPIKEELISPSVVCATVETPAAQSMVSEQPSAPPPIKEEPVSTSVCVKVEVPSAQPMLSEVASAVPSKEERACSTLQTKNASDPQAVNGSAVMETQLGAPATILTSNLSKESGTPTQSTGISLITVEATSAHDTTSTTGEAGHSIALDSASGNHHSAGKAEKSVDVVKVN
jgi:hypothetical protein